MFQSDVGHGIMFAILAFVVMSGGYVALSFLFGWPRLKWRDFWHALTSFP
jgi:hypothetical protein